MIKQLIERCTPRDVSGEYKVQYAGQEGDTFVKCLSCRDGADGEGFECVHPVSVVVNAGGVVTTVDSDGTRITDGLPVGRGVEIHVCFVCESCWSEFRVVYHFHKGMTFTRAVRTGEVDVDVDGTPMYATIWRD